MLETYGTKIHKVIDMRIDHNILLERITGRLFHEASGRVYHEKFKKPKEEMRDDITGEPLVKH